MTAQKPSKPLLVRFIQYLRRLSIRRKVTVALLVSFMLTLPTVAVSQFYFSSLLSKITAIIDHDVTIGRVADEMSETMEDVRRNERNYRIFGSDRERALVEQLLSREDSLLTVAAGIADPVELPAIENMKSQLSSYRANFMILTQHIAMNPPADRLEKLHSRLADNADRIRTEYRKILAGLDHATPAVRDSVIARAADALDAMTLERLVEAEGDEDEPLQVRFIIEALATTIGEFTLVAQQVSDASRQSMIDHQQESFLIEARAKRNIITILILTLIICVYMTTSLPRKIIRPITSLNHLLKKAADGDYTSQARIRTDDEIGELAASYNHLMDRIKLYDELRTRKIAAQKRFFDRLLESLPMPVCILTARLSAIYYNASFAAIFPGALPARVPDGGISLDSDEALEELAAKLHKHLQAASAQFKVEVRETGGNTIRFRGRSIMSPLMEIEGFVLIAEMPDTSGGEPAVVTRIGITTTVPAEVIWAAGGIPVDLNNRFIAAPERDRLIAAAERDGYPRTICAWIKGIYGALAFSEDIDTVVAVTEGDCSNTHALMETLQLRGIRTIPFAYPYRRDPARLAEEIGHLAQALGTTTEAAERVRILTEPLRRKLDRLDDLTWRTGQVTGGENHRWLVSASDFEGDRERFSTKLDAFLACAEIRPIRETTARLAYIGVPPVYDDLYEVIEGYGGGVVFNEVQRQFSLPRRTGSLVGDYLAYTYPYDVFHRLEYILPELERRSVEGVVHYVQSFCHRHIEDVVMRDRIPLPVLTLEGENPGRVDERTKVRIQAFIEMVSARRRG